MKIYIEGRGKVATTKFIPALLRLGWTEVPDINEAEVVYVASPPSTHPESVRFALSLGKHVLCEKPLVKTAIESESICEYARKNGLALLESFPCFYHPVWSGLSEISDVKDEKVDVVARFHIPMAPTGWRLYKANLGAVSDMFVYIVKLAQCLGMSPDCTKEGHYTILDNIITAVSGKLTEGKYSLSYSVAYMQEFESTAQFIFPTRSYLISKAFNPSIDDNVKCTIFEDGKEWGVFRNFDPWGRMIRYFQHLIEHVDDREPEYKQIVKQATLLERLISGIADVDNIHW